MKCIPDLGAIFGDIVGLHADRTALLYPASGERISYRTLARLVDRVAHTLSDRGVRHGDVVGIFHDKSPDAFATMLACLRLGIVYVNFDPVSPWLRLEKILATCMPRLIINAYDHCPFQQELAAAGTVDIIDLRSLAAIEPAQPATGHDDRVVDATSPAYIMFTSGSTGTPKGAVMSQANLTWFIDWARRRFDITPDDVLTNVNPIYFDNSVFDFYLAIFTGATLVPLNTDEVKQPRLLLRLVEEAGCTLWFSVPSLLVYLLTMRAITASNLPSVRTLMFGGEGFPKARLRELYDLFGHRLVFENVYGPTECTCICSSHTITADDFKDMQRLAPLGFVAPHFGFEILPSNNADPDYGELFLRGPQVGLGYYNDPQRSRDVFIQNPRHAMHDDRGYRCGDLVQRDAHGLLHFKGRIDYQIKHMGYRIELQEIEAALGSLAGVMECAVVYCEGEGGVGQIVAYVVSNVPQPAADRLSKLATLLPPYMLPRRVSILAELPKNANGKIDRVRLQRTALTDQVA